MYDRTSGGRQGFEVLEQIGDCIPIRILNTSEDYKIREEGYRHGATHCISKGIPPEDLEIMLKEGLHDR